MVATIREIPLQGFLPHETGFGSMTRGHWLMLVHGVAGVSATQQSPLVALPGPQAGNPSLARQYTGLRTSAAQSEFLPLELALEPFLHSVTQIPFGESVTEAQRIFYAERFHSEFAQAEDWLRELYLLLAPRLGSPAVISDLVDVSRIGTERERILAVDALAAITGSEQRFDRNGKPRPVTDVAAAYAATFGR